MDPTVIQAILGGLSGPGASFILLAVVLYMGWKLLNKVIGVFAKHLESIEEKFDKLIDVLGNKVQQVEAKVDEVHEDVAAIRRKVRELAERKEM
jgi:uncharacterized protein YlzI (FlbEa/FlbD family)